MAGKPRACTHTGCTNATVARRLCRAHYQQAWKAGKLDNHKKAPPRVINPTICPDTHKHGETGTCYVSHKCRCENCVAGTTKRNYRRLQLKAYGRYDTGLVDVEPVRQHVLMLGEYGIGYKRLAKICGYKSSTPIRTIIWGRQDPGPRFGEMQKRVKRETAERVLRVRPTLDLLADGRNIPARGTHRRVQALMVRGWSMSKLAAMIDVQPANFATMMQRDRVRVATHKAVAEMYERVWDLDPPQATGPDKTAAVKARKYANARKWAPPLAWDDIDLDEAPDLGGDEGSDVVDAVAVELAASGVPVKLGIAERREAVKLLHERRMSDSKIADFLNITARTVLRIREELGLHAWSLVEQQEGVSEPRTGRRAA